MTERERISGSDLAKVDAHVITPEEYDEIPELTEEWFAKATPMIGGRVAGVNEFRRAVKKAISRKGVKRTQGVSLNISKHLSIGSIGKIGTRVRHKRTARKAVRPKRKRA
jgi:hypothetical protein